LAKEPEGARIGVVEGDIFKDPLPGGHDALIVANTVHVFSAAHNIELMRKMRAHVQPGSRLLLVDLWTDPSRTHPPAAALMSGQFLLTSGEGQAYSEEEADEWLGQTSWQKLERKPLADPLSLIIAEAL
jgi:O-methyltransferase domain